MHTKPADAASTTTPANAASVYDLSIAIEFLNTALRALATGHAPESAHVREPLLWGYAKAREVAQP